MKSSKVVRTVATVSMLFGLATIISGGKALFGGAEARAFVGEAVPFVLWFNFLAGFLYISAGVGLFLGKTWSVILSVFLAASTLAVFAALGAHIAGGGAYEVRTVGAMTIRALFWVSASVVSWRALGGIGGTRSARGASFSTLLATVTIFMACDKHGHEKETPPATESGNPSVNAQSGGKEAGVKWQADATTNGGIEKMQEMVKDFDPGTGVEALKEPLGKEFTMVLEKCTMRGEAHDQLHNYLVPLKSRIDGLDNENEAGSLSELNSYLSSYWDHFHR